MSSATLAKDHQTADESATPSWVPVHRVVFPAGEDPAVLPLYLDWRNVLSRVPGPGADDVSGVESAIAAELSAVSERNLLGSDDLTRHSVCIPADRTMSFASYFNAFPASYWKQWTRVTQVRLRLTVTGGDARVDVFRSTARGAFNRVAGCAAGSGTMEFDLSLATFGDGGWLWFDVQAFGQKVTVSDAQWLAPTFEGYQPRKVSVAITTFNRPDDCVAQMRRFADAPGLLERLDQLMITDQGSQQVADADGYQAAADALGDQFRLIRQGNLGGSGGFARGMYEAVRRPASDYVMLMDDDVIVETEGILRAVQFADFALKPTIVGGHMLNLYERSTLSGWGERVERYPFTYSSVSKKLDGTNFAVQSMRSIPEVHRRVDVDYNAWWMCLIPCEVVEKIGLSIPVFIKWDDAEYGLRASEAGYPTVTLPGAAVWHMPWTDKDDTTDWQAYFHQRNRWLAALLHSPYRKGGVFPRISYAIDVKHLVSMQYSAAALRIQALEDLLRGPSHLHKGLPTINADVRKQRDRFVDARVIKNVSEYPVVKRVRPLARGAEPTEPVGLPAVMGRAFASVVKALLPTDEEARKYPEARVAAQDARWWRLAVEDSALVTTADGTGVSHYVRDRELFFSLLRRTTALHLRLLAEWPRLQRSYKRALGEITSPQAWEETFRRSV